MAVIVSYAVYGWMLYAVVAWMFWVGYAVEDALGREAMYLLLGTWVVLVLSVFVAAVVERR